MMAIDQSIKRMEKADKMIDSVCRVGDAAVQLVIGLLVCIFIIGPMYGVGLLYNWAKGKK